ncbi:RNA polymerase sigma factor [Streptomyces sp. SDT5-1]|uniref:RNA polymerase sigma factor n=1 Tax=Streptomyces sp. SDT5-1 TaxID=3406418 RepID=UPI003FD20710
MARRGQAPPDAAEDQALDRALARARSGDEAAFAAVYRHVHPGLLGYLRGMVPDRAETVAAVTWQEIARELPGYRGDGHGFRVRTTRTARRLAHAEDRRAPAASAAPVVHLLADLPRPQSEAILLRHVVGLTEPETAHVLRVPRAAARLLTHRGLLTLAKRMGADDAAGEVARAMRTTPAGDAPGG